MADTSLETSATTKVMPDPGQWTIDSAHSFISFTVEHLTIALARGIAGGMTGAIMIGEHLEDTSVRALIDATTLSTAYPPRDVKLLGPEMLDVERFPTIEFASTGLTVRAHNRYELAGDLTLHGETRSIDLDLVFNGGIIDTKGLPRIGVTATTELRRDEFGAGEWGHIALSNGGFLVPHLVKVSLDVEATKTGP